MNQIPLLNLSLRKLTLGSSVALVLLILLTVQGHFKTEETDEINKLTQHTLEIIASLEELSGYLYELGNDQRGFIITSNPKFKKKFRKTATRVEVLIDETNQKVLGDAQQVERMKRIEEKVQELKAYFEETIDLVQVGKAAQAIAIVSRGRGQAMNEDIHNLIEEVKATERGLLGQRLRTGKETKQKANLFNLLVSLAAIALVLYFVISTYRESLRREKAQAALNHSNQIQNAILQAAAFALIATDEEGQVTHFNPAAEGLLGYGPEEALKLKTTVFHRPEELAAAARRIGELSGERTALGFDVFRSIAKNSWPEFERWTYVRKDGSEVVVKLKITPLLSSDGLIAGYIAIALDISKQLEFEETLISAREQALAGTRAKSEFLANMSHEIRTPMNAILGMAELLRETNLNVDQLKYVEIFQSAGTNLLNIINDILDLSKIEAGQFDLTPGVFKLGWVVEQAAEILAVKAHQRGIELIVDIDESIHDDYYADSKCIRQVIINLLGNAVKFTRKGEVVVRVYTESSLQGQEDIAIEILDTGIGMSEEQLENMFERFSQADSSITKEFGGTGLGLNITKRLVDLMGGSLEVQSAMGIGTRFKVNLRLQTGPEIAADTPHVNLRDRHFLVVDDNRTNRLILRKILERFGARVDEAEGGPEALTILARKDTYDMILLDCRMPTMDGFSVAEEIQASPGEKPLLLMLSSDNRPGDQARSKELGLSTYLIKPILRNELLAALSRVFERGAEVTSVLPMAPEWTSPVQSAHLLLVDDNDDNRLVVRSFLKDQPFTIVEAKDGKEALLCMARESFDLVLMDMQMPVMDGYTATREARELVLRYGSPYVPIVAFSAFALSEEIHRSLEAGCDDYLTKPVSKRSLLDKINHFVTPLTVQVNAEMEDIILPFLEGRKVELVKLASALRENNWSSLQQIGHKLSGSAGSYGFHGLSEIGRALEQEALAQDRRSILNSLSQYRLYLRRLQIEYVKDGAA